MMACSVDVHFAPPTLAAGTAACRASQQYGAGHGMGPGQGRTYICKLLILFKETSIRG